MTCKEKTHEELFDEFVAESREKLAEYICNLPVNDSNGIRSGYYEIAIAVKQADKAISLNELRDGLLEISRADNRAIVDGQALHHRSKPVNHAIETFIPPNVSKLAHKYYTEYFRFHTDGLLFYAGQYNYGGEIKEPSLFFDWPIRCMCRALLFASAACKLWVQEPEFLFGCRFTGLSGRHISHRNGPIFHDFDGNICYSPNVNLKTRSLSTSEVEDRLVDTLHMLLTPLYEHFNYLQLCRNSVAHIVAPEEVTAN